MKKLSLGLFSMALTAGTGVVQASELSADEVRNGLVRFALANNELAPVQNLASRLEGYSADFLRAQLRLANGYRAEAISALKKVAAGDYYRGEAALLIGRTLMNQDSSEAHEWLELATRVGKGKTRTEAGFYLAELYRSTGNTEKAGQVLGTMDAGYWAAVGYLNLASDYAREDLNPVRALVALRVALAMAEEDTDQARREHLKGKILVRAGYLALQNKEYDKAISFLARVPLDGNNNYIAQALYLHGLALSAKGSHRASMQSWHRAKKFPLAYPGVAESWIGMGRGYDMSGYLGQSGEAYLAATAAYESERVTLRNLAEQIRQNGAYNTLVEQARDTSVEWFLADSRIKTQPRIAYLHEFLQEPKTQKAVARVAELDELERQLERERNDLSVFISALRERLKTLSHQKPDALAGLLSQQRALHKQLSELASAQLSSEQRGQIERLTETLSASASDLKSFGRSVQSQPAVLKAQLADARALKASADKLLKQIAGIKSEAAELLDELALSFVTEQDRRMVLVQDKAEQQIAHLYEYLAVSKMGGQQP